MVSSGLSQLIKQEEWHWGMCRSQSFVGAQELKSILYLSLFQLHIFVVLM